MSRSYRKFPSVKGNYSKCGKKFANRKVRRYKGDVGNFGNYKKLYEQYDIVEYRFTQFKSWVIDDYYKDESYLKHGIKKHNVYSSLNEALADWERWYVCK